MAKKKKSGFWKKARHYGGRALAFADRAQDAALSAAPIVVTALGAPELIPVVKGIQYGKHAAKQAYHSLRGKRG